MSLGFSITAIKSTDTNAILDTLAEFYAGHGLTLVEERIGSREGKYATSPRSYPDLETYYEQELKPASIFTSNFAVAENLPENVGWTLLEYSPHYAQYTPNYHSKLTRLLSSKLQTVVFEYSELDGVDFYYFRSFDQGEVIDAIDTVESEISLQRGRFMDLRFRDDEDDDIDHDPYEVIRQRIQDLYQFDLEANDMHRDWDMGTRRRFYLKGPANDLRAFLESQSAYADKRPSVLYGLKEVRGVMEKISQELEEQGLIVHVPSEEAMKDSSILPPEERAAFVSSFKETYLNTIFDSAGVLIVNETADKTNSIGGNAFMVMMHAVTLEKPIYVWNNLPDQANTELLAMMQPIVLHGDLRKLYE